MATPMLATGPGPGLSTRSVSQADIPIAGHHGKVCYQRPWGFKKSSGGNPHMPGHNVYFTVPLLLLRHGGQWAMALRGGCPGGPWKRAVGGKAPAGAQPPPPPRELSGAGRGSPGAGAGQEGPAALEAGGQLPGAWETPGPDRGPKRARMPPRRPLAWEWCKQGVLGAWECEGDSGAAAPQCPHPQIRGPWLGGTQISDPGTSRGTHAQHFPCHGDPPLP